MFRKSCQFLPKRILSRASGSSRSRPPIIPNTGNRSLCSLTLDSATSHETQFTKNPLVLSKRYKSNDRSKVLSSLIQPVPVQPHSDPEGMKFGEELSGSLQKDALLKLLNQFYRRPEVKHLAAESALDDKLFHQAYVGFRRFCMESETLPVDLHIVLSDILQDAGHIDDILPYFLRHAKVMFPHLDCLDDLRKISDLRLPANWYPEARTIQRRIIYHAGPTNSGKTYHALQRFLIAKSGVYCGPLRLLANEVFHKSNEAGTPCDLVTGEERRYVDQDDNPSPHVACTVEMTSLHVAYEVAVIDEVQMMRDVQRGWAWTRAFLGLWAQEIHVCGEGSAIDLIRELALEIGDEFEVRRYKRLTPLEVLDTAVDSFDRVKPGDCMVCFSKNDIYHASRQLERRGVDAAVIYGTLPPGTKLAQAAKFNDPNNPCKVMVATDAIGMGINLNIKRVIFYSLIKPTINEKGEKEMDLMLPTTALQIAGRAGRYGTEFDSGEVTTFRSSDLPLLKKLLETAVPSVEQAGLHPTAEQIELFAYHLPKATLSNLIDIFVTLSTLDSKRYFMCDMESFKFLADMIEHIPLQLRVRYVFCCAPIPKKQPFACTMFLKFSRQFSRAQPVTLDWLVRQLTWPFQPPETVADLVHLEAVFDVLDLYLWLSYRFTDMFPDAEHIRDMQKELDAIIQLGVFNITKLLKNSESAVSSGIPDDEDDFEIKSRTRRAPPSRPTAPTAARKVLPPVTLSMEDFDDKIDRLTNDFARSSNLEEHQAPRTLQEMFKSATAAQLNWKSKSGKKLAQQLVEQGLLTKEMLAKLQQELTDAAAPKARGPKGPTRHGKKRR